MKLNKEELNNRVWWEKKGYNLPLYDREKVKKATMKNPIWIHFGAGNIFRAFLANVVQNLLNVGELDRGLIVSEGYDYEIVENVNRQHDDYSLLVTLKADGSIDKTVVGSVVESCILDSSDSKEFERLKEIFKEDSLQMASFTITEKGYCLLDSNGEIISDVKTDFENGPKKPESYIGKVTALLYERFKMGKKPIAMVSMDNCSHNGDMLFNAVSTFAKKWSEKGLIEEEFVEYIEDKNKVSFPWSMIDKITPRPDKSVEEILKADGLEQIEPVITSKNTYVASFVNAEECEYLVIEDSFPNGRPQLEKGGIMFTNRETVDKVEKMKVCTCLNPLHTALAIFGCLLGYEKISDEMKDRELFKLVECIGYKEGLPVVINPVIIDPKEFINKVINVRIPNPFMPDTPQRIATDTSKKLAIRFGETIRAYEASRELDVMDLKFIPLVFAGWFRYLMGIDDNGNEFKLSSDPLLERIRPIVQGIKLGDYIDVKVLLEKPLRDKAIFGVDLFEVGLANKVCDYFADMIKGVGAVRDTLKREVV